MTNPLFDKFMKTQRKIPLLLASKVDKRIEIKVKIFLMITTSLNFKMVYYIMMDSCMNLIALLDSKYYKPGMML
jgi:hypothetical protein